MDGQKILCKITSSAALRHVTQCFLFVTFEFIAIFSNHLEAETFCSWHVS